ncbi:NAT, n-acetyltransferase, of n-acetylglutamate synthase domain-containing protein [Hirsutella rhossiliensis]|uniref:Amino-acid acetyltransferase, mitochondrial n=1 Tax=Hirsutella rhossiliensis TaxID=111463 RepID=A0A9P8N1Z7_9HYPO|nr:NAT, n-acetyltransferase, of n-acetylglutamate synthase domain-containing protein [Hirsutella rhossiliensis]KAH0964424.1 NAT, n-acetyltransferase, of n-acetylglutamate synthase domain-containing protein [Hirsutella rhossiliensis]
MPWAYRGAMRSACRRGLAVHLLPRLTLARLLSSPSTGRARKLALDREVVVSVLESSATSREAKGYLQKYASRKVHPEPDSPQFVQGVPQERQIPASDEPFNVAIVTLRMPQRLPSDNIHGIARTLTQLRALGLLAIVVVDCGLDATRQTYKDEAWRLCEALDSSLDLSAAKVADNMFAWQSPRDLTPSASIFSDRMRVDDQGLLERALQHGMIVIAPCLARRDDISAPQPAEAHETVLTLTKYLNGMQFQGLGDDCAGDIRPRRIASVERLIVLDPLGGTPMPSRPDLCHRLINLEQEYSTLMNHLATRRDSSTGQPGENREQGPTHAANLNLAKDVLSLLPPSSSALVTTPRQRNPLLHNLLTDRPASSPSLPLQRIKGEGVGHLQLTDSGAATLVKRGMPGASRLRLTDTCIDLPRLVHLIEDSFNRKLDVQAYLDRVNDNLAGIIIAGEYEGGAIFTWERPAGIGQQEAYDSGRLVPYLDKFAVLRDRQGSGGVADIVFNAMVQDCFPRGVCWRSRKNNPVNKWYFERSAGICKLRDSGWAMFWTTLGLSGKHPVLGDYETVCRGVQPTWADNNHILE